MSWTFLKSDFTGIVLHKTFYLTSLPLDWEMKIEIFNGVKLWRECERIIWTFAEMPPSRVLCLRDNLDQVKCEGNEQLHPRFKHRQQAFINLYQKDVPRLYFQFNEQTVIKGSGWGVLCPIVLMWITGLSLETASLVILFYSRN